MTAATTRHRRWARTVGALTILLVWAGCDRVTRERFNMIREGLSDKEEVRMTLGPPDADMGNHWQWHRHDRHVFVTVDFDEQGIVRRKQWLSPTEQIDTADKEPRPGEPAGSTRTTIRIDP